MYVHPMDILHFDTIAKYASCPTLLPQKIYLHSMDNLVVETILECSRVHSSWQFLNIRKYPMENHVHCTTLVPCSDQIERLGNQYPRGLGRTIRARDDGWLGRILHGNARYKGSATPTANVAEKFRKLLTEFLVVDSWLSNKIEAIVEGRMILFFVCHHHHWNTTSHEDRLPQGGIYRSGAPPGSDGSNEYRSDSTQQSYWY